MSRPLMVDINTLSEYLSISKNTIYYWVNQRKIPCNKAGRLLRFDINEIDKWLQEHKREVDNRQ